MILHLHARTLILMLLLQGARSCMHTQTCTHAQKCVCAHIQANTCIHLHTPRVHNYQEYTLINVSVCTLAIIYVAMLHMFDYELNFNFLEMH